MSFKTKAEVDRHVEDIFRKCTSDHDVKLKSLCVGKLYLNVKAYDPAVRHFQAFLSVNENSPETYKLLGKCFQQLGKIEKAIASYKRSLELEPLQPALILLICELMNQMNLADIGISSARLWCEKGNNLFPNNPVVQSLKQKIIVAEDKDPKALEKFYLSELKSNPNDENILINLLNLYVDTKQYATAHKKVLDYQGNSTFRQSLGWHRCLSKVYKFCLKETLSSGDEADYLLEAASTSDNYLSILHSQRNDGFFDEAVSTLELFDQLLWKVCAAPSLKNPIDKDIQKHFLAQLAYHMAVLLLKKLIKENASKDKALELIGPGLLFAQASPFDLESPHLSSLDPKYRTKMKYLVDDAIFRVVQSNLMLRRWSNGISENEFISNIMRSYSKETRALIFSKVSNSKENAESSCWLVSSYFDKLPMRLLSVAEVVTESNLFSYERRSSNSYHDMVWLGVQALFLDVAGEPHILPQLFRCQCFQSCQNSPQGSSSVSVENLSKIDIDNFLYLSVFSCYLELTENKSATWHSFSLADAMPLIPTEKQLKFWTAVHKTQKNEFFTNDSLDLRSILIKGIETVRLVGHHGLDLKLLIHVAKTFESHARSSAKQLHVSSASENRAFLYWSNVIRKLELLQNQDVYESSNTFFPFKSAPIKNSERINQLLDEGRFFIAYKMMRNEDFKTAIDAFKLLRSPNAALNEALIYKQLAQKEIKDYESDEITSGMRTKHNMWLMKAKEALKVGEERIRGNPNHPLHAELERQIEEIDGRLFRYDRDFGDGGGSDSMPSSIDSNDEAESSFIYKSSLNALSHNLEDLRVRSGDSTNQRSFKAHTKDCSLKDLVASQTKMLKFIQQLGKRVETIELDVSLHAKSVKKTERRLERVLSHLRSNPIMNPVYPNMPMANLMFQSQLMQNPNFYPPNIPGLQSIPPIIPPFLPPGMAPFLPPGLPLMPPLPLVPQAQPFNLLPAQRPILNIPQVNSTSSMQQSFDSSRTSDLRTPNHSYTVSHCQNIHGPSIMSVTEASKDSVSVSGSPALAVSPARFNLQQPAVTEPLLQQPVTRTVLQQPAVTRTVLQQPVLTQTLSQPVTQTVLQQPAVTQTVLQQPAVTRTVLQQPMLTQTLSQPVTQTVLQQPAVTPTLPKTPFFKPSTLSLNTSNASVTAQNLSAQTTSTPSKQVFATPAAFTPNAVSTPPPNQAAPFKLGTTPSAKNSPVTSTTDAVISSPKASQDSRSKISEPLFNLLTNSSSSPASARVTPSSSPSSQVSSDKSTPKPKQNDTYTIFSKPDAQPKSLLKETLLKSVDASVNSPLKPVADVSINSSLSSTCSSPFNASLDFASITKKSEESTFKKSDTFKGFEGQGSTLFGSPSFVRDSDSSPAGDGESADDFVPTAEFQPVIALPELIVVKTGEEGLTVLYEERCKLLRFDAELKEWKERGVGKMKILHDPVKGTVRFLMRREQVHKVCCNQNLLKDLVLKPVLSSDKAWTWSGLDFSEGEETVETFALRFKNSDLAHTFFAAVEDAKNMIGTKTSNDSSTSPKTDKSSNKNAPLSELFKPETGSWECTMCYTRNGKEKSKCLACESPNPNQSEPAPATPPKTRTSLGPSVIELGSNTSSFTFGIPQSAAKDTPSQKTPADASQKSMFDWKVPQSKTNETSYSFGIPPSTKSEASEKSIVNGSNGVNGNGLSFTTTDSLSKSIFSFELGTDNKQKSDVGVGEGKKTSFIFGKPAEPSKNLSQPFFSSDTKTVNGSEPPKTSFSLNFTNGNSGIFNGGSNSLGAQNGVQPGKSVIETPSAVTSFTTSEPFVNPAPTFAFGANARKSLGLELGFGSPKSFNFSQGQQGSGDDTLLADQGSDGEDCTLNDSEDNIYFEPVIPLPDEIIPTTGEEDETVLYCHLAKLYRFRDGEWKERGTGDVKILRHNVKGDIRFVMRRKPIDVVCLNHFVTKDIEITPKDAKSWTWSALDFSDGTDVNLSEMKPDVFSLRFKSPEIAGQFKAAIDSAIASK